jgi:Domain of unknown function (DUF4336)
MLTAIADRLWVAEQPLHFYGLPIFSRMTVIALPNQDLIVISPITPTPQLTQALDQIGTVRYIIAPNLYHHLFAQDFANHYPEAEFWAVNGILAKRPDLKPDKILIESTGNIGEDVLYLNFPAFRVFDVTGNMPFNEYLFLHRPSKTLVITDAAFNFGAESHGAIRLLAKVLGMYGKLRPTFLERFALRDRESALATLHETLTWDFDRVIMAHGSIIQTQGKAQWRSSCEWYLQTSNI